MIFYAFLNAIYMEITIASYAEDMTTSLDPRLRWIKKFVSAHWLRAPNSMPSDVSPQLMAITRENSSSLQIDTQRKWRKSTLVWPQKAELHGITKPRTGKKHVLLPRLPRSMCEQMAWNFIRCLSWSSRLLSGCRLCSHWLLTSIETWCEHIANMQCNQLPPWQEYVVDCSGLCMPELRE